MRYQCPICKSIDIKEKVIDSIGYTVCEIEFRCGFCNSIVDYWAYGNYESDCPSTPSFCWHNIKLSIIDFFRKIYWRTKIILKNQR